VGSLSAKNASEKFSRLGTFKKDVKFNASANTVQYAESTTSAQPHVQDKFFQNVFTHTLTVHVVLQNQKILN
jgi:hypothetical protein